MEVTELDVQFIKAVANAVQHLEWEEADDDYYFSIIATANNILSLWVGKVEPSIEIRSSVTQEVFVVVETDGYYRLVQSIQHCIKNKVSRVQLLRQVIITLDRKCEQADEERRLSEEYP